MPEFDAVGQGEVDDPVLSAEGHGGLGHILGQNAQAASLPARQQHGDTLFTHYYTLF